jgi:hypothetical protein
MAKSKEEQELFDAAWKWWTPRGAENPPCFRCYGKAVTLHEIEPRSTNRGWMQSLHPGDAKEIQGQERNSVPVCATCHEHVQRLGVSQRSELRKLRDVLVANLHTWKRNSVQTNKRK